ncbi:hypothetical protein ACMD2_07325 [Ananas comosus]|uniref:Cathepsin propeptide inhibitor domain-containing protein n=1 Tax=Ananas comosus TaxID=4615 RepID=A0A199VKQ0_ANACO|nr:hypothetical protein ACMD2_07325 [Ananas comosus]
MQMLRRRSGVFQIFKQTVERCERHNAKKKGHIAGLTCFADLTSEEFTARFHPIEYPPWVYEKMREERERKALRYAREEREREALRYAGPPEDLTCFGCGGPY